MRTVLISGASGYLGSQTVLALAAGGEARVIAVDVRPPRDQDRRPNVLYETADVRQPELRALFFKHKPDVLVHLASIVTPGAKSDPEFEYSVDVLGTRNAIEACLASGVKRIVVSSSGAAYGYHADNPEWLKESDALRGNDEFPYARHKRLVEEMLAAYRTTHPQLQQTIFRIGTILGASVRNQITALFDRPRILALSGSRSPFVFIWDQDVVECIQRAVFSEKSGIFNVAGDGVVDLAEIAQLTGKKLRVLSPAFLRFALAILHPLRLSRYGPEQVKFLQYRPVLDNARLKAEFGFVPRKTSREVLEYYLKSRGMLREART